MKKSKTGAEVSKTPKPRRALDPDARENQMISLAVDLAEEQLRDGTAKPSVIVHYLKLGTSQHRRELEKLENENKLLLARVEALESAKRSEELYAEVLKHMRIYSGVDDGTEEDSDIF